MTPAPRLTGAGSAPARATRVFAVVLTVLLSAIVLGALPDPPTVAILAHAARARVAQCAPGTARPALIAQRIREVEAVGAAEWLVVSECRASAAYINRAVELLAQGGERLVGDDEVEVVANALRTGAPEPWVRRVLRAQRRARWASALLQGRFRDTRYR